MLLEGGGSSREEESGGNVCVHTVMSEEPQTAQRIHQRGSINRRWRDVKGISTLRLFVGQPYKV